MSTGGRYKCRPYRYFFWFVSSKILPKPPLSFAAHHDTGYADQHVKNGFWKWSVTSIGRLNRKKNKKKGPANFQLLLATRLVWCVPWNLLRLCNNSIIIINYYIYCKNETIALRKMALLFHERALISSLLCTILT